MYLAIIILPLLGSIASGFFGVKIGAQGSHLMSCTAIIITVYLAGFSFLEAGLSNILVSMEVFRWIDCESLNVGWAFNFDSLTSSMLIPVLIVSSLVHLYSIGYMSEDPHNQRFFSYLSLFTFMMVILLTANNYLLMFVGWEGVGVCSYLLVCFWFTRIAANQSSLSAFLTNRVGDCFLTVGMFIMLLTFGNLDYSTVFSLSPYTNEGIITIIGVCLLLGAMAKSSQVGLHVWLPMAMEGPTPVSALIHAATMVTAGVYLLMRSSPLIEFSVYVLMTCLWLGTITNVFSSLIGLFQQDIKKVIAYSTMSQLGMMVIAVGLSSYSIALFHLINHAFYKALLFLGAGSVIHAVSDNQDFRKYGGLRSFLPLTYSVMLIASLSLAAIPFMTGFYSKDFILESSYGMFCYSGTTIYTIATIGAMFTTLYSVKVLYLTFLTNPNGPSINYKNAHEGNIFMSLPLMILAVFSIFFGFITKDAFIGIGSDLFSDNGIFIHPSHEILLDTEFGTPTLIKLLPLIFTISLSFISTILSEYLTIILIYFKLSRVGYNIFSFFNQRFLIELFYNKFITGVALKLGGQTTKIIDKGSVEYLGPYGLQKGLFDISNNISKLNSGFVTTYALYILAGLMFYILVSEYLDNSTVLVTIAISLSVFLKFKKNIYDLLNNTYITHEAKLKSYLGSSIMCNLGIRGNYRSPYTVGISFYVVMLILFIAIKIIFFAPEIHAHGPMSAKEWFNTMYTVANHWDNLSPFRQQQIDRQIAIHQAHIQLYPLDPVILEIRKSTYGLLHLNNTWEAVYERDLTNYYRNYMAVINLYSTPTEFVSPLQQQYTRLLELPKPVSTDYDSNTFQYLKKHVTVGGNYNNETKTFIDNCERFMEERSIFADCHKHALDERSAILKDYMNKYISDTQKLQDKLARHEALLNRPLRNI